MTSGLTQAMIVNAIVLVTVLASDLGPARKIGRTRVLRPVIAAAVIIPLYVARPAGHGAALSVEVAGAALGLVAGLAVAGCMRVYRHPDTGRPVSRAGFGYAALWTLIVGARAAFSYGAVHWFGGPLVRWATANDVTVAAITDGLIFMAVVMIIARTASLRMRANRLGC